MLIRILRWSCRVGDREAGAYLYFLPTICPILHTGHQVYDSTSLKSLSCCTLVSCKAWKQVSKSAAPGLELALLVARDAAVLAAGLLEALALPPQRLHHLLLRHLRASSAP